MKLTRKDALIAIIAGLLIALAGTYLLGITAALPMPFETSSTAIYYLWDVIVIQFFGIDLLAALVSFFVIKRSSSTWWLLAAIIFLSLEFYLHWVIPVAHSEADALFSLNLETLYAELLILAYIFAGSFFAYRKK